MKRLIRLFALLTILSFAQAANAQIFQTGSITTNGDKVTYTGFGAQYNTVRIAITGTWTGTIEFRGCIGAIATAANCVALHVIQESDQTTVTNTTGNNQFSFSNTGFTAIQTVATASITGTASIVFSRGGFASLAAVSASVSGGVSQGSTTSGQSGFLVQGAVTTSAPSYTTAQTSPFSLTPGGLLRTSATVTDGTNTITDPCTFLTLSRATISITASAKIISQTSSKKNYICGGLLIASAALVVNFIEGTGSTCGTSTAAIAGSTTAANGMSLAANGGFNIMSEIPGTGTNVDSCISISGSGTVAGYIVYVQQ